MEDNQLRIQIEITITGEYHYYPPLAKRETIIVGAPDVIHSLDVGDIVQSMKFYATNEALAKLPIEDDESEADDVPQMQETGD